MNLIIDSTVYTQFELENRFKKVCFVGSGGEGNVYEVKENNSDKTMALKIANNNWEVTEDNKRVVEIISVIGVISPHLTKINELFSVRCPVLAKLTGRKKDTFFEMEYDKESKTFDRRAMLLELLDGDVSNLQNLLSLKEKITLKIQMASISLILRQQGVNIADSLKPKNVLYKTVDSEDLFQGKTMIDFDFWKYVFGKQSFYLPTPKYLFKLADYDPWTISDKENLDPENFLEGLLKNTLSNEKMTLEDVKDMFSKPDKNTKILDVYDSSKISLEVIKI